MLFNDTAPPLEWDGGPPPWLGKFADDVTMEAGVLRRPVHGKADVLALLKHAIRLYEFRTFTYRGELGSGLFFESYRSSVQGVPIENLVMVHTNGEGFVDSLVICHRPLGAALLFSRLMWEQVGDRFGKDLFLTESQAASLGPSGQG